MKTLSLMTVVIGALVAAGGVTAQPYSGHTGSPHKHGDQTARYGYHDRGYHQGHQPHDQRRHHCNRGHLVRINIPVDIRGDERVHLRRALHRRYNINTDNYHLHKVVVDNHAHRRASARLRVGSHTSDRQALHRGSNHLTTPGYSEGRWVLSLNNARVTSITVVLEPKRHLAAYPRPHRWMRFAGRY